MAIINKTGITTGGTIEAEHVTRAIDALSGGSTDSVVATGSFQGTLSGTATTASYVLNAVSSSFATTASFALNAGAATGFPFTGSARITGSLSITGSFSQRSSFGYSFLNSDPITNTITLRAATLFLSGSSDILAEPDSIIDLSGIGDSKGALTIPVSTIGTKPLIGSMYFDTGSSSLYIYDGTQWTFVNFGT